MKWTINEIRNYYDDILQFDHQLELEEALKLRDPSIIHLEPVHATGYFVAHEQEVILHAHLEARLTLPSTRTLEPVVLDMAVPVKERYVYPEDDGGSQAYEETTIVLDKDYIDLETVAVDAILASIPMKVIGPDEADADLPSGRDWIVLSEDDYLNQHEQTREETVDPRFAALQQLLDRKDD